MENAILHKIPIDVDLNPNRNKVYSGICLKETHEVFILICFNEDSKEYDGFAILRSQEIESFRYWEQDEMDAIVNDNHAVFENQLPLPEMNTFYDCLRALAEKDLVAVFTNDDDESYHVGKIEEISETEVTLQLINTAAEWTDKQSFEIADIS